MTNTLHTRLLAAVQQRMDVARAMLDACAGDHRFCGDECEEFQRDNDPATVLRHCERDMRVLERHALVVRREHFIGEGAKDDPQCEWCDLQSNDGDPLGRPWPCAEITDLAAAYGIEVTD